MSNVTVEVFEDRKALVEEAALRLTKTLTILLGSQDSVHLAITGGSVGTDVLKALSASTKDMDLANLHIWWIDERFVASSSAERNELQARLAWLDSSEILPGNIHPFPSSDSVSIEEGADAFAIEINTLNPTFDLVLLGMGEDGHIASLFPGSNAELVGDWVVIERNSPKPPAMRLSLSLKAINSANEAIFLVSGSEKAAALKEVFSEESNLPAALVEATTRTTWLIDSQAGSELTSS
jgi:6-phosphogluconolactonase